MPTLVPVDNDPFAAPAAAASGAAPKLVPVDHDPFAAAPTSPEPRSVAGTYSPTAEMTPTPGGEPTSPEPGKGIVRRAADAVSDTFKGPYGMSAGPAVQQSPVLKSVFENTVQPVSKVIDAATRPVAAVGNAAAGAAAGIAEDLGMRPGRADALERDVRGLETAAGVATAAAPGDLTPQVSSLRPAALEARKAGYVLPPASISEKPGLISNVLAGWSGKIKTQQAASARNQVVTNDLATKALGLPAETTLTEEVFNNVRQQAGQAYQAVVDAVPSVKTDKTFKEAVEGIAGKNSQAAKAFPNITKNPGIAEMADELLSADEHPTRAWVDVVRELRFNGNANLKAMGDPSKHALGLAQREAANAIDDMMERQIAAAGKPEVVDAYKAARRLIAKSYDVEGATNTATGDVSARGLARLADKGKPLTDELKTISDAASAFPKAMQAPSGFGDNEAWSALDFFGSAGALAHGNPGIAGTILARPLARGTVLSQPYQNFITRPNSGRLPIQPLAAAGVMQQNPYPPSPAAPYIDQQQ